MARFGTLDGLLLVLFGAGYTFGVLRQPAGVRSRPSRLQGGRRKSSHPWLDVLGLVVGIALIVLRAALHRRRGRRRRAFGVSDAVIGFTIIAIGASAPRAGDHDPLDDPEIVDIALGDLLDRASTTSR